MISANAMEFRLRLQRCLYEEAPRIPMRLLPSRPDAPAEQQAKWLRQKDWLEHHAREYIIDDILSGLNWQMHRAYGTDMSTQNMAPEVALDSGERRRFLDYFGFDHKTDRPLLIVEAKRPSARLPSESRCKLAPNRHPSAEPFARYLAGDIAGPSELDGVTMEWRKYLDQLKGYVQGLTREYAPKRVVIMNGDWMVIFLDPAETFFPETAPTNFGEINIYPDRESMLEHAEQIFGLLAYGQLSSQREMVHVAEVAAFVDPATVVSCAFGLKVRHERHPPMSALRHRAFPQLRVAPVLFIASSKGTFMRLESSEDEGSVVPLEGPDFEAHLSRISQSAQKLKLELESYLTVASLPLITVEDHYGDQERFQACPGVAPLGPAIAAAGHPLERNGPKQIHSQRTITAYSEFIVFTGQDTHFITQNSSFTSCPYHAYAAAANDGAACDHGQVSRRSIQPRSIFVDGNVRHCAHHHIFVKKQLQVLNNNRSRCGPRSAKDHGAFCEIWGFEQHLCCRVCVYQKVCTAAPMFAGLPCTTGTGR